MTAAVKFPATHTVHWPSGPVHACEKHAGELVGLSAMLGGHTVCTAAPEDSECSNCINEAANEKR